MQIKTTVRYHLTCIRISIIKKIYKNAGEGMEKRKFSYTIGGKVKWYKHYGEQYGGTLKKLNIELLYDPASPLLGMYLEKTIIQKNACTPLFTAALLTISKTWKKPKCPSTEREEWIKVQYMYRYTHTYTHTHIYTQTWWNITQPQKD